jgi:hypothetical protein
MLSRQGDRCGRDKTGATPRFFPAVRDSMRAPDGTVKTPGLKALALYEKGKALRNEHDLRKLFTFLPAALQERIIRDTEIIPGAPFAPDPKLPSAL